jgi:hypothetical protein
MARWVKVAAAQMGPIDEGTSRDEVVDRMLALLDRPLARAGEAGVAVRVGFCEKAEGRYFTEARTS